MIRKHILPLTLCLGLLMAAGASAAPTPVAQTFAEVGNNVDATWQILDLAVNASGALPLTFEVTLCEDDVLFDDFLGTTTIVVQPIGTGGTIAAGTSGGYRSGVFTHTFPNASDAATGVGNDFYLTLDATDCPNRRKKKQ